MERLSQRLIGETKCENLIVKMASDGFIVYQKKDGSVVSQHYPALSVNPLDVAGAGDSLLSVMALGLSAQEDIFEIAAIGCCMSQLAVETMGNTPINKAALKKKLEGILGER